MSRIGELITLAHSLRCSLEKAFSHGFSIWSEQGRWQPISDADLSSTEITAVSDAIRQVLDRPQLLQDSETIAFADGRQLLMVVLNGQCSARLLVVGIVGPHDAKIVRALADSILVSLKQSRQLEDATRHLDQYIYQITADFEELAWLRSLAEHFEICDVRNGLTHAGQATLPSLRQLIGAQVLYLFGMPRTSEEDVSQGLECPLLHYDGDLAVPEERARRLIAELKNDCQGQTIVWNEANCVTAGTNQNHIRNYILAPVTKSNEQVGWLLALNKNLPTEVKTRNNWKDWDINWYEFGTTEAGLMDALAIMLATHGRNVELLREKEALLVGVIRALVNTIDAKDAYTCGHSDRVALISKRIAQQLGFSAVECEQIHMAGLLHDIGKIGVPDSLLGKPGELSEEEFAIVKTHPTIGVEILKHLKPLNYVLPGVLHHHETVDGKGYPHGLVGDQIPLLGRIIAVADSYDAMTSSRTYRKGFPTAKAESILRSRMGTQWDCRVIEAFFAVLPDIYAICGTGESESETMNVDFLQPCCEMSTL